MRLGDGSDSMRRTSIRSFGSAAAGAQGHKGFALGQFAPGRSTPRRRRASSWGDMYAKCGSMEDSRRVFDSILHPNVMSLMLGYVSNGESDVALDLFERMQARRSGCKPNSRTRQRLVAASRRRKTLFWSMGSSSRRLVSRPAEASILKPSRWDRLAAKTFSSRAKCGIMLDARSVFDEMSQ
ncbi:pentatricopeptide repeat-containing protein At2g33760-like [Selaginella moellendorffii]|uniref:pentatricopeptide repeat-containing protein At2g33760-like n=1 Tax=Selaginella moellendorffii TaxID=88036 RepID=UPI000D1CB647|nr:pentatricopeptide repeat-containing protein At2g33760-like [Selaginella moellendorffii]|eukprot:XP_024542047.1 pentatricopeptide repeat-containing protein At2g33760-like [Selaginella moellendorffii]